MDHCEPGRGLGIVAGNLNGTPGVEVYVANDMTANCFWTQDERGRFREIAGLCGLANDFRSLSQGSMGIAVGDFFNNLQCDFLVTNFEQEHNAVYVQTGANQWQDLSESLGVAAESFPWVGFGTSTVDLDNDGVLEILTSNGHVDFGGDSKPNSHCRDFI